MVSGIKGPEDLCQLHMAALQGTLQVTKSPSLSVSLWPYPETLAAWENPQERVKGRTVLNIGSTFNILGFLCSTSRRKKAARHWEVGTFQTSIPNMAGAACGLAVSSSFQCGGAPRTATTSSLSLIQRFWGSTAKSSLTSQGTDGHCWTSQPPTIWINLVHSLS